MKLLHERIQKDAVYLGDGIVKVDSFLNHQIDPMLMDAIGDEIAMQFREAGATKIVTAEVSGIPPALAVGRHLNLPVVYARKGEPVTMGEDCLRETVHSRTGGKEVSLKIARYLLSPTDRVLIVDDFLARGATLRGLSSLILRSGAEICGIACVLEKPFEGGRSRLEELNVPIVSLARLQVVDDRVVVS